MGLPNGPRSNLQSININQSRILKVAYLGPILPRFRDIRAFVHWKPLFHILPLFRPEFRVFPME